MVTKAVLDRAQVVVICPDRGQTGEAAAWQPFLDRMTKVRVPIPDVPLYLPDGATSPLPAPRWGIIPSLIDGNVCDISLDELNPQVVRFLHRVKAEWRFHRGTWDTQHPAITFRLLAKHRSATPEAPAYPVKHQCSQVQDWQTVEWTTFHPQTAYLLQYVYGYLTQGHERNNDYVRMNPVATGIIRQGLGVYATRRLRPDANTPWATTEPGAHVHAYQPTMPCRLPHPADHNTVIFAGASATTSVTPAAEGAALEVKVDTTGRLHQHHITGATIFGASSHGKLKTLAIVVDAVNDTHQELRDHRHHVWVVVDAVVDSQIARRLARQPLHKATDSSLGTQALHLWTALRRLPKHVVLHLVKQESHRYSLGNIHIDLHAHNQLAEHMPDGEDPPLRDHMHTHLKHLPPVPRPGEPPAL